MDFSSFSSKKNGSILITNWQYSVLSVSYWNIILYANCAIPVVAFQKATEQKASYIDNNTWEWKFKVGADSLTINAKLQGKIVTDSVEWKMYISTTKSGNTSADFLWFTGASALDQTGGWWLLNENPVSTNPLLKINWTKKGENEGTLKYTYVKSNDPAAGGYIEYGTKDDLLYDTYYTIYGKTHDDYINIEWNKTTKEGRIKSSVIYTNNEWHCWNSSFANITCNN